MKYVVWVDYPRAGERKHIFKTKEGANKFRLRMSKRRGLGVSKVMRKLR